ncbi:type II toxin-antitoxin system HicB family antitoxin [Cohnella mopanensis]|uniref:type II toxin-antitoxin system HicB family antitoxin n=1 Tax=Cohnella mopanensis TaxID=2911966 RepID=UPI0034E2912F
MSVKFHTAPDGITISFRDLPGALSCGYDPEEALRMAAECLSLHILGMVRDGDVIPAPTAADRIILEADEHVEVIVLMVRR